MTLSHLTGRTDLAQLTGKRPFTGGHCFECPHCLHIGVSALLTLYFPRPQILSFWLKQKYSKLKTLETFVSNVSNSQNLNKKRPVLPNEVSSTLSYMPGSTVKICKPRISWGAHEACDLVWERGISKHYNKPRAEDLGWIPWDDVEESCLLPAKFFAEWRSYLWP